MLRHATLAILALACDAFMLQPAAPVHRPAASLCAAPSVSPVAARASVLEMAVKPKARPVAKKPVGTGLDNSAIAASDPPMALMNLRSLKLVPVID